MLVEEESFSKGWGGRKKQNNGNELKRPKEIKGKGKMCFVYGAVKNRDLGPLQLVATECVPLQAETLHISLEICEIKIKSFRICFFPTTFILTNKISWKRTPFLICL